MHAGPHILQLDYIDANGLAVQRTAALGNELVCQESDLDPVCLEASLRAAGSRTRRASVGPFAAPGASGAPMNRWPLFNFLDHGWIMGVDMANAACQHMKPAGWWGWKLAVGTSTARGAGTDGNIRARWSCDGQAATNGWLPLDCKFTLGDALDGNWEKLNCFERGDYNTFAWQHNNLTSKDGTALLPQHRVPDCFAAGSKPVLALEHKNVLDDWKVQSLILQLAYTQGPVRGAGLAAAGGTGCMRMCMRRPSPRLLHYARALCRLRARAEGQDCDQVVWRLHGRRGGSAHLSQGYYEDRDTAVPLRPLVPLDAQDPHRHRSGRRHRRRCVRVVALRR